MQINDLPRPVTASKADWLPSDEWLGFTPKGSGPSSYSKCQSTIQDQLAGGYVIEYVTEGLEDPNPGFENHPRFVEQKKNHDKFKGRLIAVHRLKFSSQPLENIIGQNSYNEIQNMWRREKGNARWSVAFPIIESYEIVGMPKAKDVFGKDLYYWLYRHPSATLRPLRKEHQHKIATLSLKARPINNFWIAIQDELKAVERSKPNTKHMRNLSKDLDASGALEGLSEDIKYKIKRRSAWLANQFILDRKRSGTLTCDLCNYDPASVIKHEQYNPRTMLDVHHTSPLSEGVRYTSKEDLALLCPTCHRLEHAKIRLGI